MLNRVSVDARAGLRMLVGCASIALGAQVAIPMVPVSTTLQTFAILTVGILWGSRVGSGATALYVLCVLVGLPVLSEGGAQPGHALFAYPAAGYVFAFVLGAAIAGSGHEKPVWMGVLWGLFAHVVILACGAVVLSLHIGVTDAWWKGVWPFLFGAVVKSMGAAGTAALLRRSSR